MRRICLGTAYGLTSPAPGQRSAETEESLPSGRSGVKTRADLQRAFARWLWHYNHTRLHTGAGMQGRTPLQALRAFEQYRDVKQLKCYPC